MIKCVDNLMLALAIFVQLIINGGAIDETSFKRDAQDTRSLPSHEQFVQDLLEDTQALAYSREYNNYMQSICSEIHGDFLPDTLRRYVVHPTLLSPAQCRWIMYEAELYAATPPAEDDDRVDSIDFGDGGDVDDCSNDDFSCTTVVEDEKAETPEPSGPTGWMTTRHQHYPTTDIEVTNIPAVNHFLIRLVHQHVIPLFQTHFQVPAGILGVDEVFIVKYSAAGQSSLAPHKDGDDFSFVISLNSPDEYVGGGTRFINIIEEQEQTALRAPVGSALLFCGQNNHTGVEVINGSRYVIAGFLSLRSNRFCSAQFQQPE
jgi:hypothetical protein